MPCEVRDRIESAGSNEPRHEGLRLGADAFGEFPHRWRPEWPPDDAALQLVFGVVAGERAAALPAVDDVVVTDAARGRERFPIPQCIAHIFVTRYCKHFVLRQPHGGAGIAEFAIRRVRIAEHGVAKEVDARLGGGLLEHRASR